MRRWLFHVGLFLLVTANCMVRTALSVCLYCTVTPQACRFQESCQFCMQLCMCTATCTTYIITATCGTSSVWHHSIMSLFPLCFLALIPPASVNLSCNIAVVLLRVPVLESRVSRPRTPITIRKRMKQITNHWHTHSLDTNTLSYLVGEVKLEHSIL